MFNQFDVIFWDFDGVIKDSIIIKGLAFESLFSDCNKEVLSQIRKHHLEFGGLSRFEKIPIYLKLAGISPTELNVKKYSEKFSHIVKQSVIDSPWVPGVFEYLESNYLRQKFILVTATPKIEIDEILTELNITEYFREVYGSPMIKVKAIALAIEKFQCDLKKTIMIGDSISDFNAAKNNNLPFVLRKTDLNAALQRDLNCFMFKDFING
jgi:phosphoglycolate phosphatase-like HAD superfamily hydrolase